MLAALLGAFVTVVYGALLEWAVHRFGYHREAVWKLGTRAHRRHHEERYPPQRFFERGAQYQTSQPAWLEAAYVALHAPALWVVWQVSAPAAAAAALTLGTYAALAHYVHPATHLRRGRWYEQTAWFRWLVARHARHHRDQSVNFNLLLPLGDWLFGTLGRRPARCQPGA